MLKALRDKIEEIRWGEAADPSRWVKFGRRQVQLYFYILRELVRNRYPQQAAALTFTTLLSVVPLLAVAFSFFRGFAALEDVETRAQEAIFRTMLAGPLLERKVAPGQSGGTTLEDAERLLALPAGQMLAEADRRSRAMDVGLTLRLYLGALDGGADAARVRVGLSTLRLARVTGLGEVLRQASPEARGGYLRAAGMPEGLRPRAPDAAAGAPEFQTALRLHRLGRSREALEALGEAESAGYPSAAVRRAAAGIRESIARQIGPAEAVGLHRSALLDYCDALVLAAWSRQDDEIAALASAHGDALTALGEALFTLGSRHAELYDSLAEQGGAEASEALETALAELSEAARLGVRVGEVDAALGRLYLDAGRMEPAARAWRAAYESSREGAARGISVAVVDYIRGFIDKVGRLEIGILGIVFLLVTATSLFTTIEQTLNQIWQVTERRPFWSKFTSFCTLVWLGPALIGASAWAQERLGDYVMERLGSVAVLGGVVRAATAVGERVLPFLTIWVLLMALYKFLPYTRVRASSVAWGGFLSALLLTAAKPLFGVYVLNAVKYEKIYGSLGAVPIFLLWMWLLWMIVLFGAEVSFAIQNIGLLQYRDKLRRLSRLFIDRYLAARTMMYVAREFWETGRPVGVHRLAEIMQITPEEASDTAARLVRLGLLTPVGEERDEFHPARDLSRLKVSEVLSVTDKFRAESRSARPEDGAYEDKLETAFRSAIQAQDDALGGMTFRDLLLACERDAGKRPGGPAHGEGGGQGGQVTRPT